MARAKTKLTWDELPDETELKEVAEVAGNCSGDVREVHVNPEHGYVRVLVSRDTDPLATSRVFDRVQKLNHERYTQTVQTGVKNDRPLYGDETVYEVIYEVAHEVEVEDQESQPANVHCDPGNDAIRSPDEQAGANRDATDREVRDAVSEAEEWDDDPNAHLL